MKWLGWNLCPSLYVDSFGDFDIEFPNQFIRQEANFSSFVMWRKEYHFELIRIMFEMINISEEPK